MNVDLDTFLVQLYSIVDDLYKLHGAAYKPRRPGQAAELSDSEVITLTLLEQGYSSSEEAFWRYAHEHLRPYFPRLLDRTAFNRRSRDLCGVMVHLVPLVAQALHTGADEYEVIDAVPVELMSRCRGDKHRLFGCEASIGRGGSDKDWFYGCRLLISVTDHGAVTGFTLAPAATEERWAAESLLCWRKAATGKPWTDKDLPKSHKKGGGYRGPTGPIYGRNSAGAPSALPYLADLGFAGAVWDAHWRQDYDCRVITQKTNTTPEGQPICPNIGSRRQVIETVNALLVDVLHLRLPGARSMWGLLTRVAAKLLAVNLGQLINRQMNRPPLALATLFTF